jgi:hypothetical protein
MYIFGSLVLIFGYFWTAELSSRLISYIQESIGIKLIIQCKFQKGDIHQIKPLMEVLASLCILTNLETDNSFNTAW